MGQGQATLLPAQLPEDQLYCPYAQIGHKGTKPEDAVSSFREYFPNPNANSISGNAVNIRANPFTISGNELSI